MSSLAKIALYLLAVVLLAALLSPVVYWAVQASSDHAVVGGLAEHPFYRVFSRVQQVVAIVLLVPLLFWLRIRHVSQLGLQRDPQAVRHVLSGLLLALIPVLLLGALYLGMDFYRIRKDLSVGPIFRILGTASVVAVVEEFLFRGVLLGLAVQAVGKFKGVLAISLVFAFVHFLKPAKVDPEVVTWLSGFAQWGTMLAGAPSPQLFFYGFLSLLLAGLILGFATIRTRALWLAIGLHAGWIAGQQGLQWLAKYRIKPPEEMLPWVGPNLVSGAVPTGLLPLVAIALTGLGVAICLKYRRSAP